MVDILPLRGLHYSQDYAEPSVFSPPFDVISPSMRTSLLQENPFNVVRLTLRPPESTDAWYAEAARSKDQWIAEGVLERDQQPAFYGYQQEFTLPNGERTVRTGFIGRVRLRPWAQGIHPHELTRVGPRVDRLKLMQAMATNTSPVFGLYQDSQDEVRRWLTPPGRSMFDFTDWSGVRHIVWRIQAPEPVSEIMALLKDRDIVIADGHHRYETALAYRNQRREEEGNPLTAEGYDYVMMYMTAIEDPGLTILPTHRIVGGDDSLDPQALIEQLRADFEVVPAPEGVSLSSAIATINRSGEHVGTVTIGLCLGEAGHYVLRLESLEQARAAAEGTAPELAELDVMVLQNLILEPCFGIALADLAVTDRITYTVDEEEACAAVHSSQAEAAFILNATDIEQVWRASLHGVTMPQKSTYFYPKLLTGLVFSPLDNV
jgi:uncharacterized protein (DUF1015 family)